MNLNFWQVYVVGVQRIYKNSISFDLLAQEFYI
jgi:hypothetical protein